MHCQQERVKAPLSGRSVLQIRDDLVLRDKSETADDTNITVAEKESPVLEKESCLVCVLCRTYITSTRERIEINQSHVHTFLNPGGLVFRIGCFSHAPGCFVYGEGVSEHSWFREYLWYYALCPVCNNHLGWFYSTGGSSFYGLILDHLVEGYE